MSSTQLLRFWASFKVVSQKLVGGKVDGLILPFLPPMSTPALFKWWHFLPQIIRLNVRWYCRYALSYRNLEEMMAERGVEETIQRSIVGC